MAIHHINADGQRWLNKSKCGAVCESDFALATWNSKRPPFHAEWRESNGMSANISGTWGLWYQKQASRVWPNNHNTLGEVFTRPCPRYLRLAPKTSYILTYVNYRMWNTSALLWGQMWWALRQLKSLATRVFIMQFVDSIAFVTIFERKAKRTCIERLTEFKQ